MTMNQQEIDRLWSDHHRGTEQNQVMQKQDFTAALQEATAQARREALSEAAKIADAQQDAKRESEMLRLSTAHEGHEQELHYLRCLADVRLYNAACRNIAIAIRALAAQPQEGNV